MMNFERASTEVSVTAMAVVDHLLLAGVGGHVQVYDHREEETTPLLQVVDDVFRGAAVHGFRQGPDGTVAAFGGKQIALLSLDEGKKLKVISASKHTPDWVLDVGWDENRGMVALTAHNRILFVDAGAEAGCEEKCILYSGRVVASDSVVLAGTVFREIVVWSYRVGEIAHRIHGHEGVIFSISYDPGLALICSTSDDRTARLWNVEFKKGGCWEEAEINAFKVLRCSAARVFRSCFLDSSYLAVGGEDSTLCVYRVGDWDEPVMNKKAHGGSPVWSLAASGRCVYSGGGDCAIRRWPVDSEAATVKRAICLDDPNDHPKVVRCFKENFLCLTDSGRVLYVNDDQSEFRVLYKDDKLQNYGLMEVTGDSILLATISGLVIRLDVAGKELTVRQRVERSLIDSRIFSLHAINQETILICGSEGKMLLRRNLAADDGNSASFFLPLCGDQRWPSAARWLKRAASEFLLVGDRHGGLHAFDVGEQHPVDSVPHAHGRRGIGDIWVTDDTPGDVWTTGRDGLVKSFALSESGQLVEITCVKLALPWIERIVTRPDRTFLVAGFHSRDFVLFDPSERRSFVSIPCGGGHRSWDLLSDGTALVVIKDNETQVTAINDSALKAGAAVKPHFHSREISVVHHFELGGREWLATAGEDVTIRIHRVETSACQLVRRSEVASLKSHLSSVKTIKTLRESDRSLVMVSAGGRAQLKVWRLSLTPDGGAIVATEKSSHMFKGGDKRRRKTWRDKDVVYDAEMRYMDVEIAEADGHFLIVAVCSDGVLRLLKFNRDLSGISVLAESDSIHHCFLTVARSLDDHFVTTSTDGILRTYTIRKGDIILEQELAVNQSGCNSMCFLPGGAAKVAIGGDDGSVAVADLDTMSVSRFLPLHSGQVTGMEYLNGCLLTCSVDQRLAIWNLKADGGDEKLDLTLKVQRCSDVADVQSMAVWKSGGGEQMAVMIALGGGGLELFRLKAL